MIMETLILYPKNKEELEALKAVAKVLKMKFKTKSEEKPYNPEFVAKIEEGRRDKTAGRGTVISQEELDSLWK